MTEAAFDPQVLEAMSVEMKPGYTSESWDEASAEGAVSLGGAG
jgi:hypothetical protein